MMKNKFDSMKKTEALKRQTGNPALIRNGLNRMNAPQPASVGIGIGQTPQGQTNTGNTQNSNVGYNNPNNSGLPRPVQKPYQPNEVQNPYQAKWGTGQPQQSTAGTVNGIWNSGSGQQNQQSQSINRAQALGPEAGSGLPQQAMQNAVRNSGRNQQQLSGNLFPRGVQSSPPPSLSNPYDSSEVVGAGGYVQPPKQNSGLNDTNDNPNNNPAPTSNSSFGTSSSSLIAAGNPNNPTPADEQKRANDAYNALSTSGGQTDKQLQDGRIVERLKHYNWSVNSANGDIVSSNGNVVGNIDDPAHWDETTKEILGAGGFLGSGSESGDSFEANISGGFPDTPGSYADDVQNAGQVIPKINQKTAEQKLEDDIANSAAITRADYAKQKAHALRAAMQMGAYGNGDPNATQATMGDISSKYGIEAEKQVAAQSLQVRLMDLQAQYDKAKQENNFDMMRQLAAQQGQLQKELVKYQVDLENKITGQDIFGGLLNAGGYFLGRLGG